MSDALPTISIIVPVPPGMEAKSLGPVRQLQYPREKLEIFITRGRHPSAQRNQAALQATGEWLYFLDDDSIAPAHLLQKIASLLQNPEMVVIGGPAVCPPEASDFQHAASLAMSSPLAFGSSRARYVPVGSFRQTTEKELILCNLMIRRSSFHDVGGFPESLYPNEENALLDRLQQKQGKIFYDPEFEVARFPRPTFKAYTRMVFNYGRGRAEQVRVHPTPGSVFNFIPAAFVIYLLTLPFLPQLGLLPLLVYVAALLLQVLAWWPRHPVTQVLKGAALVVVTHAGYGLGLWRGLFSRLRKPPQAEEISVEKVAS